MTEVNTSLPNAAQQQQGNARLSQGGGSQGGNRQSGSLRDQARSLVSVANQARQQASQQSGDRVTRRDANRLTGLTSSVDTEGALEKLMQVEQRRLRPVQAQKTERLAELESFGLIRESLSRLRDTAETLGGSAIWEGKLVESSNEDVVTATATSGAKPGKHTLIVEQLALNHQLASQSYESQDTVVGTGRFMLSVGEEGSPITVTLDEANNTLQGLRDAINEATDQVEATIIRTGERDRPYQLVLTSQTTGSEGRISLETNLREGEIPNFSNRVDEPSDWKGIGEPPPPETADETAGTGASTSIVQVVGDYTGEEDTRFTFTAVQTGRVGQSDQLQVRWRDNEGRSGMLELDRFNYAPGEPVPVADGLEVIFSRGEIVVGDKFSFEARAERPDTAWWLSESERASSHTQPTSWQRQREFGAPVVEGEYTGEEEQTFTLTVEGSGQVGEAENLRVRWEGSAGESGVLSVGQGYKPGTTLALTDGITLSIKQGVLTEGQTATFDVSPRQLSGEWWLPEEEREIPASIGSVTEWRVPGEDEGVEARMPSLPEQTGPRISSTDVTVSGEYTGDEGKVYTFTAVNEGSIGTTQDLSIRWEDDEGNSGELAVGEAYEPGQPLEFDSGLAVAFSEGRIFAEDQFTLRTRTSTIQPPQDAQIRFGATELGGGLEISSSDNELEDVIDGVTLNLESTSDQPVTITIRGDTDQAMEKVKSFVDEYNELNAIITELTKYDDEEDVAGPLLGNRDVMELQTRLSNLLSSSVPGLPQDANMLMAVGVQFNDQGQLELDESKLREKVEQDFGQVADLFRNRGSSDNSGIAFVGMSDETAVSTDGYPVDVTQVATRGAYETPVLDAPILVTGGSNRFTITVDGRQSEALTVPEGVYSLEQYARVLQDQITNDERVGEMGARVLATDDGRVRVLSGRHGSRSNIAFAPVPGSGTAPPGLLQGNSQPGQDARGTINGQPTESTGQLLRAVGDGSASGLRVFAELDEDALNPNGPEARITVTRGVGSRTGRYLSGFVDPTEGRMKSITDNLRRQIDNIDEQLERMQERIQSKRQRLQERFSRMESQMGTLKAQQQYMQQQLAGLPSGGGGGAAAMQQMLGGA